MTANNPQRSRLLLLALAMIMTITSLILLPPLVRNAHAIVGRPLTPMSYAGVARRTTRRSVAYGGYGAAGRYW